MNILKVSKILGIIGTIFILIISIIFSLSIRPKLSLVNLGLIFLLIVPNVMGVFLIFKNRLVLGGILTIIGAIFPMAALIFILWRSIFFGYGMIERIALVPSILSILPGIGGIMLFLQMKPKKRH